MNEYIKKYLEYLTYQRNYSENTIKGYEEDLLFYQDFLNKQGINILEVDYQAIRKFYNYMDDKKLSKNTISRRISAVRNFYKYLARGNYVEYNPFCLTKGPKKDKLLPKFLYYNELEELFDVCDMSTLYGLRDRVILEILYSTGIRVGELENIKIKDIDTYQNQIKVLGKGNKERLVYYGEYLKEVLDLYLSRRRDNNSYLLINSHGDRLSSRGIRYILNKLITRTSLKTKVTPHMLRHTFATHLLNEGCDILTVQELLGHESLRATQVYTHVTNDRLKDVYLKTHPRNKERFDEDEL